MPEPSVAQGSMFEALFVRVLKPTGRFAEELKVAGYDPAAPQATYPTPVWARCLELAAAHIAPGMSREAGYRQLGRRFTEGFLNTLAGKVVAVALPFLKAEGFLQRMPRYTNLGRSDLKLTMTFPGERQARGKLQDPYGVPAEFMAGILEKGMELTRARPVITVHKLNDCEHDLEIRW